jgi:predicted AlkP superfamily phosphohydrolase/phosphomutase
VIGIDGATWTILAPMISKGELPHFQKLVMNGVSDTLLSTVPPLTAPSWTSMFTGVNPGKHGIVDFILREKDGFVPALSRYRMCKSIWRVLSDAGLRCIIINDPVTYPPERINGIMITGLMTPPGSVNWIHPKELRNQIDIATDGYECDVPPDIDMTILNDRSKGLNILENLAQKTYGASKYVATNFNWDVLAVIFTTTDRLQHFYWNDNSAICKHYQILDEMLGEYLKMSEAMSADLLVVSDHGFGPTKTVFRINDWLAESGLASYRKSLVSKVLGELKITKTGMRDIWGKWPTGFRILPAFMQEFIRTHVPENRETKNQLDAGKSVAYSRGWAGIFVSEGNLRDSLAKKLRELTDEASGIHIFEKVMNREDVLHGPYLQRAAELLLLPSPGFHVLASQGVTETTRDGNHRPEGIFIHYRPYSRQSRVIPSSQIRPWDIAALIFHILGVPIPDYFDGALKIEID